MKNAIKGISIMTILLMSLSCTKDDNRECSICNTDITSVEVCLEEDGTFSVDGETIDNPNNASLEDFISAIEANPNNDPELEGVSCTR